MPTPLSCRSHRDRGSTAPVDALWTAPAWTIRLPCDAADGRAGPPRPGRRSSPGCVRSGAAPTSVQIGLDPAPEHRAGGLTPRTAALLDGTSRRRFERPPPDAAPRPAADRVQALVAGPRPAGVLARAAARPRPPGASSARHAPPAHPTRPPGVGATRTRETAAALLRPAGAARRGPRRGAPASALATVLAAAGVGGSGSWTAPAAADVGPAGPAGTSVPRCRATAPAAGRRARRVGERGRRRRAAPSGRRGPRDSSCSSGGRRRQRGRRGPARRRRPAPGGRRPRARARGGAPGRARPRRPACAASTCTGPTATRPGRGCSPSSGRARPRVGARRRSAAARGVAGRPAGAGVTSTAAPAGCLGRHPRDRASRTAWPRAGPGRCIPPAGAADGRPSLPAASPGAAEPRDRDNGRVTDLPRRAVTRTAKLATPAAGLRRADGDRSGQAGRRPAGRGGRRRGAGSAPPSSCSRCSASSRAGR